jgi:hypothetical protein
VNIGSTSNSIDPRRNGWFVPAIIASLVACSLGPVAYFFSTSPGIIAGSSAGVIVLPILLSILVWRPQWTTSLLIASIAIGLISNATFSLGVANARPNMLVALFAIPVLGYRVWKGRDHWTPVPFLVPLLGVNAVYLLATLKNPGSPFFMKGLADCVLFLVNVAQYVLVYRTASQDRRQLDRCVKFFFWCTAIFCFVHVTMFILASIGFPGSSAFLVVFQGETGDFTRVLDLETTQGSYLAFIVATLLAFAILLPKQLAWKPMLFGLMVLCSGAALALTFARGAWLGVGAGLAVVLLVAFIRFPWKEMATGFIRVCLVLFLFSIPVAWFVSTQGDIRQMFVDRIEALTLVETGTIADRVQLWLNMADDFWTAPILGHGAHNYAKFREDPTQISENFVLEMFHSAGAVGGGLFLGVVGGIAVVALRTFSRWKAAQGTPWGIALTAGYLGMFVSSLSNPAMLGGFFWAAMALVVAAVHVSQTPPSTSLGLTEAEPAIL